MKAAKPVFRLTTKNPEETRELGRNVGTLARPGDVYLLTGNLGAGKTCFTQGIARGLDIEEYVISPSFVIMREHHGRLSLYHIDLYRLENVNEAADLGLDDYLYGKGVCVVEWAERALNVLPAEHLAVRIEYTGDEERSFQFESAGKRYEELISSLRSVYSQKIT